MPDIEMVQFFEVYVSSGNISQDDDAYFKDYAFYFDAWPEAAAFAKEALDLHPGSDLMIHVDVMTREEWDAAPNMPAVHQQRERVRG